jgi:hypothetical protein
MVSLLDVTLIRKFLQTWTMVLQFRIPLRNNINQQLEETQIHTLILMFSKELGEIMEKHIKNTSVCNERKKG